MASNVWVTVDDVKLGLASPGPWVTEDDKLLTLVVNGVDSYIKRVRPDLKPPASQTSPGGGTYSAFSIAFNNAFVPPDKGSGADASWAALQLALHWWSVRGSANPAQFQEFGVNPVFSIPRFVEEALEIGRSHGPVVA
jgi:hypothetical protein